MSASSGGSFAVQPQRVIGPLRGRHSWVGHINADAAHSYLQPAHPRRARDAECLTQRRSHATILLIGA